jgi:hypothetical protein
MFERNIFNLVENLKQGTLILPRGFSPDELLKIRRAPNGRLDLLSVGEVARSMANTIAEIDSSELKSSVPRGAQPAKPRSGAESSEEAATDGQLASQPKEK